MQAKFLAFFLVLIFTMGICQSQPNPQPAGQQKPHLASAHQNDFLYATLWYQRSQEAKALCLTQYKMATLMLDKALQNPGWTADPNAQKENFENKPPAIILDIDETVLDNTPFTAWLIQQGLEYNDETWKKWDNWALSLEAKAIPGAVDFIKYAQSKNVKVFYITNRDADQEEITRKNLKAVGLTVDEDVDTVLLKKEKKEWGSAKSSRRSVVAEKYRILLLIGDNLGDFVDVQKLNLQERDVLLAKYQHLVGERWIFLPNPIYGSWEAASFDFNYRASHGQQRKLMQEKLIPWSNPK